MFFFSAFQSYTGGKKGFSLVELAIVILIIGVIASISIPLYLNYRKKAITVEATTNLVNIYKFELGYFAENSSFTENMKKLGFFPRENPYYDYKITAAEISFTAEARGNIDGDEDEDVWTINDKQAITHLSVD